MHVAIRGQLAALGSLRPFIMGPREKTQVVRLCGKHLYLLSHLTGPIWKFFMVNCVTGDLTGLHFEDWRLQEKYSYRMSASIPQIHTRRLDSLCILRCDIWEVIRLGGGGAHKWCCSQRNRRESSLAASILIHQKSSHQTSAT